MTRSSWFGLIGSAKVRPGWPGRRRGPGAPAVYRDSPAQRMVSLHEIRLDDDFRDLLANALIARRRAQIPCAPELMLLRETWAADGWACAEADQLIAHIRAATEHGMLCHEEGGQRILKAAVT